MIPVLLGVGAAWGLKKALTNECRDCGATLYSSSTLCDGCREDRREARLRKEAEDKRNAEIEKGIQEYQDRQEKYFTNKYDVDIVYDETSVIIYNNYDFEDEIEVLSIEADRLQEIRRELEEMRDAL